jgi:long-subunit acyl-CoA synthetase (AMP-forming)
MGTTTQAAPTVCAHFEGTAELFAPNAALRALDGGEWSWHEYRERVRETAAGLAGLGLRRGDVMACWLGNRPEFHIADTAAIHLGAASFSIYETSAIEHAKHVVADSSARILVTDAACVEAAIAVRESGETELEHVVCVEGAAPEALGWDELLDAAPRRFNFERVWRSVTPSDLATVIYTPGTTGPPKGVELTHANISAQTLSLSERLGLPGGLRAVSFMPMAQIAGRLCAHYLPMFHGWEVNCCPDAHQLPATIRSVRPGYLFSPPRVWEELRAHLLATVDEPARAELTEAVERVRSEGVPLDGPAQAAARASVGLGELAVAVVGVAPCARGLIEFWYACGVALRELYGMSETTGAATVAAPRETRIGSAGTPLPSCEVRLADDGEICVRGPVVTRGYRNLPARTAQARDDDGWWHSGDIGQFDERGHLRVVDRIDELIVSSTGAQMSPAGIEATLSADASLVAQACVIGDSRPFNVALLTLDPDGLRTFIETRGIRAFRPTHHRDVIEAVGEEVSRANARLSGVEQIKRFALLAGEWLPDGDELTATLTLKRRQIGQKYAATIAALYDGSSGFVPHSQDRTPRLVIGSIQDPQHGR